MAVSADNVQKAYLAYFGRPADPVGLAYWMTSDAATMKAGFAASAEYAALYAGMTSTQMVSQVYTNLLGRAADVTGLLYWSGELAAGRQTVSSLVDSMQANVLGIDVTTVANRLTYATAFTAALDTTAEIVGYSGNTAAAAARTAVLAVVDTAASLTAAQAALTTSVATVIAGGTSSTGTTFTLTTGVDSITGTSNNDTILAMSAAGASAATDTLAVSDSIDGGAGTDTLTITNTASGVATAGALIKNVETINIRQATAGQTSTHDASTTAGVTAVNANLASGVVTVTNLATGASAGMIGDGTLANGAFNAGYVAAATAGVLNLSGGTTAGAVTMSGTGLTSQTVNSTGATNVIGALALAATDTSLTVNATTKLTTGALTNTTAAALTTLTVTGAGAVSFGATALEATVTKIDASANTGGLTVALGSAVTQAVTGSAGNDVITTSAILTTGSVNAGAGTDTLALGNVNQANTASLAAKYTNFETLRVNGTFDASLIAGITAVELSGAVNAITNMTATQAAAVTARANIGATTLALATATGTADVLTVKMGTGLTTSAATTAGALTVTGFETVNIVENGGATAAVGADSTTTIASFVGATLSAVNMTGRAVTLTDAATTVAATFNASALTGDGTTAGSKGLTLSGSLIAGSTVTGSGFIDTIVLGTAGSTYNLGAGNDTISGTLAQYRTTTTYNTIDAGAGTDTATISDGAGAALTVVDDDFKGLTNVEKITITDTTTGAQAITTGGWFDAGFKAAGATLTTTSTTGAITITAGSFTGNMTLTTTSVGTAAAEGRTTVTTGSGNDTISVTTAAATTLNVITAGAGNDTITHLGASTTTITGGTGADTMTGVAAVVDTYKFANTGDSGTPSATNFDTITNWATTSDLIDFTGALTYLSNATTSASGVAALGAGANSLATFNAADSTLALQIIAVEAAMTKSTAASNGGTAPTALNATSWVNGGSTYVFVTDGTAGVGSGDTLIKLTGVVNTGTFTIAGGDITAIS